MAGVFSPQVLFVTAFVSHKGFYHFKDMPFSLSKTPATFQCLTNTVLAGLISGFCVVNLGDIVVASPTFEQGVIHKPGVSNSVPDLLSHNPTSFGDGLNLLPNYATVGSLNVHQQPHLIIDDKDNKDDKSALFRRPMRSSVP